MGIHSPVLIFFTHIPDNLDVANSLKRLASRFSWTIISISVKECCNEVAQCAFVVDKILEITSEGSSAKCSYGNIDVLYRRQVSGKVFQAAFRDRKKPFNIHGVVRAIIAMLRTTLPGCDDGSFCRVFKALQPFDKEEKKKMRYLADETAILLLYSLVHGNSNFLEYVLVRTDLIHC
ncbi:unnamed protein product [Camellia sinensis]